MIITKFLKNWYKVVILRKFSYANHKGPWHTGHRWLRQLNTKVCVGGGRGVTLAMTARFGSAFQPLHLIRPSSRVCYPRKKIVPASLNEIASICLERYV